MSSTIAANLCLNFKADHHKCLTFFVEQIVVWSATVAKLSVVMWFIKFFSEK